MDYNLLFFPKTDIILPYRAKFAKFAKVEFWEGFFWKNFILQRLFITLVINCT